jgi:hypothetical protein
MTRRSRADASGDGACTGNARRALRRVRRLWALGVALVLACTLFGAATRLSARSPDRMRTYTSDAAILTVVEQPHAKGVLVTTGGWAYCQQVRALARRNGLTLLCGRFAKDGYVGPGLRERRHLDWGNPDYLRTLAREAAALHGRVAGQLVLVGVSYSGFGVRDSRLAPPRAATRPFDRDRFVPRSCRETGCGGHGSDRAGDRLRDGRFGGCARATQRPGRRAGCARHRRNAPAGDLERRTRRGAGVQGSHVQPVRQRRRPPATRERA